MRLRELQPKPQPLPALLTGHVDDVVPELDVTDVATDSRAVVAGGLFLAFAGSRSHGLAHAEQAIANGARAIAWDADADAAPALAVPAIRIPGLAQQASAIAARFYGCPAARLFVTGITGTDGKTSCAWLLARALDALGTPCGLIGTLGVGVGDALAPAGHTTPDPVSVQRWLARFAASGVAAVAVEVSSHALAQHRVDGVAFDVALLTQIGRDHLDYHGSAAAYAAAKRRLFDFEGLRCTVINGDDATGRGWLASLPSTAAPIVYGESDVAALASRTVRIAEVATRGDGLSVALDTFAGRATIESRLIGRFNAHNLAAVAAVLLARGEPLADAAAALAAAPAVPGRMQRIGGRADQPLVIVDYAHTAGALTQALAAVRAHTAGRVLCVFGCGGERDRGKRPLMGRAAVAAADAVWITDDNPRGEDPGAIVADIRAGLPAGAAPTVIHDRALAIAAAIAAAGSNDAVLIAGKGHETTQQSAAGCRAFDDRRVAARALEAA